MEKQTSVARRIGKLIVFGLAASIVACADSVSPSNPNGAADRVDAATITFYNALIASHEQRTLRVPGHVVSSGLSHSVVLNGQQASFGIRKTLRSGPHSHATLSKAIGSDTVVRLRRDTTINGHRIAIYVSKIPKKGMPPRSWMTSVDGHVASITVPKWKKKGGKWQVGGASVTQYDTTGKAMGAVAFDLPDVVTTASLQQRRTHAGLFVALADAVSQLILPRDLLAQSGYGPCDILYQLAYTAAAATAEKYTLYLELEELCQAAILEGGEAAILVCADADLAVLQYNSSEVDSIIAHADWIMCLVDEAAASAMIAGDFGANCSLNYFMEWIYIEPNVDPDNPDGYWYEGPWAQWQCKDGRDYEM
jgi:hypothetical protein